MIFGSPDSVAPTSKRTKASLSELDFATNDLLRPTVSSITISLFLVALSFALAIWGFVEYAKNKDQVEASCSVSSLLLTLNLVIASSDSASTVLSISSILLLLSAYIKISWSLYSDEEDEERDFDEPTKIIDRNDFRLQSGPRIDSYFSWGNPAQDCYWIDVVGYFHCHVGDCLAECYIVYSLQGGVHAVCHHSIGWSGCGLCSGPHQGNHCLLLLEHEGFTKDFQRKASQCLP